MEMVMTLKLTIEEIRERFKKFDCELISDEYKG